ncbi:hypothetical protein [Winogradskyella flava]|uniref:DUF4168 domain-containing protein n=1 Tax=Winogradskyella flava TaxID=1884876 RepID=A0A842IV72_9FLAO|nr:hypothetical protein [Winogradskyella flava]MBC2846705.1 hypothetical protein [Winogradskyella flava]
MRYPILLFCFLTFSFICAQPGGGQGGQRMGGGRQGGQMNGGREEQKNIPEFDAAKVAGIFSYSDTEAIKKMKLKNDEDLELKVSKAISKYNMRMDEVTLLNTENFDTINDFMNTIGKRMRQNSGTGGRRMGRGQDSNSDSKRQNGDFDERDPVRKIMHRSKEKVEAVKAKVLIEEGLLNKELESLLSEKQYKKWLKYQNKVKKEMTPEEPSNNRNQNSGIRGGTNGGQGGRPGGGRGGF